MSTIKTAIELEVKEPNLKGFRQQLRELTLAAQEAVVKFGEFSPEAIEAERRVAELRDRMDDFNDRVAAVNPDKFAQINTVVSGVARGFQAAQGAMALFGSESEDLQKTLVRLQGAMALAEGLEGLGKVQQQFGAIAGTIKGSVVKAFSTLRGAIIATGIGALAVGLALVAANFDKVKTAILNMFPFLEKFGKFMGNLIQRFTDFVGITSESNRQLEAFNKTTNNRILLLDREIEFLRAQGKELEAFAKEREKLNLQLAQARANYGKNAEKEWGKIIGDTKNALRILEVTEKNYLAEQAKMRAEARAKELEKEKQHRKDLESALSDIHRKGLEQRSALDAEVLRISRTTQAQIVVESQQLEASNLERMRMFWRAHYTEIVDLTSQAFGAITYLNQSFEKQDEASRKRAFENNKKLQIANTIIGTLNSIVSIFANASKNPASIPFPAYPYIQASLAGVYGFANVQRIRNTQYNGGTSAPSAPTIGGAAPTMTTGSTLNENASGNQVYVLEGDITRTQQRVGMNRGVSVVE